MFQVLFLSCLLQLSIFQRYTVEAEGSKARFDKILASFGFTGLSDIDAADISEEGDNDIQDNFITETDTVSRVKNGVFVIKIRRKHPIIRRKKLKTLTNFLKDKEDLKFLNHLNERIQNPVFKSKYPERRMRI